MKVDIEYEKSILDIMQASESSTFDLNDLKAFWDDESKEHKFVFHLEIFKDQNFIEATGKTQGIGVQHTGSGSYMFSIFPLRLTALGHDYIAALSKPGVLKELSTTFKDLGPSETVKVGFKLGAKAMDNMLTKLVDE